MQGLPSFSQLASSPWPVLWDCALSSPTWFLFFKTVLCQVPSHPCWGSLGQLSLESWTLGACSWAVTVFLAGALVFLRVVQGRVRPEPRPVSEHWKTH